MNKKTILMVLILVISLAIFSITSFADERSRGNFTGKCGVQNKPYGQNQAASGKAYNDPGNRGDVNFRGMINLDLSEEQIAEIRQMMIDFQKDSLEFRNQIQMKRLEIRELMLEDSIDMDQVKAKLEEIAQLQVEVKMQAIERQTKVQELLTPEQLEDSGWGFPMQKFNMGSGSCNFNHSLQGQIFQGNKDNRGGRW